MKFLSETEFSSLLGQRPFFWIQRMGKMLSRQHVRRKAKKTRRALLNLGPHLLQDLGFDPKGCPLKPNWFEKFKYDRWQ